MASICLKPAEIPQSDLLAPSIFFNCDEVNAQRESVFSSKSKLSSTYFPTIDYSRDYSEETFLKYKQDLIDNCIKIAKKDISFRLENNGKSFFA